MNKQAVEKQTEPGARKCPVCDQKIENPDINYCLNCRNIIWAKSFYRKRII